MVATHSYRARITVTIYRDIEGRSFDSAAEDVNSDDIKQWIADTDSADVEWETEED